MTCEGCGLENGLHETWCTLPEQGWDQMIEQLSRRKHLEQALAERGYVTLFAIGCGQRPNGTSSIKIAARPGVRNLAGTEHWTIMRQTIHDALDRLMDVPMDDLEIES